MAMKLKPLGSRVGCRTHRAGRCNRWWYRFTRNRQRKTPEGQSYVCRRWRSG